MDDITLNAWDYIKSTFQSVSHEEDQIIFKPADKHSFSINATWKALNPVLPTVSWYSLIWSQPNIPRNSFITWLAIKNGLITKDKLFRWGVSPNSACAFCNNAMETVSHLFFACSFSKDVWNSVLNACSINRSALDWNREERNRVVFKNASPKVEDVINRIKYAVCGRLSIAADSSVIARWL
ncbi:uncharacterized protein LOC126661491 [Mercurialis annua]|uniref:uncharacterized protein LOC126661491 n=1 Tax=Mercurialis annua TaxID=3986 RepID=UPI00215E5AC7|nr:uncharacterized protein LOC126661491 [Mercurialis annua]